MEICVHGYCRSQSHNVLQLLTTFAFLVFLQSHFPVRGSQVDHCNTMRRVYNLFEQEQLYAEVQWISKEELIARIEQIVVAHLRELFTNEESPQFEMVLV